MPACDDPGAHRLERWVHWTLLSGLLLSATLLIAGLLATLVGLAEHPPERPASASAALRGPVQGQLPTKLLELGLLVLMATPVLRVLALAVGWTITGEPRFALVAVVVLVLLGLSLVLGFG